jgi:hypothetical protein
VLLARYCVEESRKEVSGTAVIITVDVCLNEHWTDLACGVDDTQMNESMESLKVRHELLKRSLS